MGNRLEARVEEEFVPGHQFQMSGYELEIQEEIWDKKFMVEKNQQNVLNLGVVENSPKKVQKIFLKNLFEKNLFRIKKIQKMSQAVLLN